ncbi:unnamed protein product [Lactuca saligna]|uniref:3-hydroxyacyl-CoA dehydrogenase NAD binding domain-containing protein n=1 Tax=Lactuca saligna TaxID=75948 RepID=A0AA35Z419_LACSI|nr:unnamed protein product [Lactuca saligna]
MGRCCWFVADASLSTLLLSIVAKVPPPSSLVTTSLPCSVAARLSRHSLPHQLSSEIRRSLFEQCYELQPTFQLLLQRPDLLALNLHKVTPATDGPIQDTGPTNFVSQIDEMDGIVNFRMHQVYQVTVESVEKGIRVNLPSFMSRHLGLIHTPFRACKLKRCKRKSRVFYRLQNGCGCTRDSERDWKDSIFIRIYELSVRVSIQIIILCFWELTRFIAAGKLHYKIHKVAGVLETNHPDAKNALYHILVFNELVVLDTSKGLVHIFFAQRAISKVPKVTDVGLKPRSVKKVAVIGGGLMGSGIAIALILANIKVVLNKINTEYLQKGIKTAERTNVKGFAARKKLPQVLGEKALSNVNGVLDYSQFRDIDMVIEILDWGPFQYIWIPHNAFYSRGEKGGFFFEWFRVKDNRNNKEKLHSEEEVGPCEDNAPADPKSVKLVIMFGIPFQ